MTHLTTRITTRPPITEVDPLFEMLLSALGDDGINEATLTACRKRLEKTAEDYYKELLKKIDAAYKDANAIRIGLQAPETSMARKVAEAFTAGLKPDLEKAKSERTVIQESLAP